jgi:hypothetical protein
VVEPIRRLQADESTIQVDAGEPVSNFAWLVAQSMRERQAPNAGSVLVPATSRDMS